MDVYIKVSPMEVDNEENLMGPLDLLLSLLLKLCDSGLGFQSISNKNIPFVSLCSHRIDHPHDINFFQFQPFFNFVFELFQQNC